MEKEELYAIGDNESDLRRHKTGIEEATRRLKNIAALMELEVAPELLKRMTENASANGERQAAVVFKIANSE
jgi:hypothetical protein